MGSGYYRNITLVNDKKINNNFLGTYLAKKLTDTSSLQYVVP